MRFGLDIAQHQLTWDEIVHRARLAEDAGLDGVWAFDHFKALYADPLGPSLEAWTWPPCNCTRLRTRVRPMPNPPCERSNERSAWVNSSKT